MRRNGKRSYQKTDRRSREQVVAVSDVFEESARKAAEICGAKVYADSKELINAENVDAVFIVSPGFAHEILFFRQLRPVRGFSVRNHYVQLLRTA